jgi:hypothetical protein
MENFKGEGRKEGRRRRRGGEGEGEETKGCGNLEDTKVLLSCGWFEFKSYMLETSMHGGG